MPRNPLYSSKAWYKVRDEALRRDRYRCVVERCPRLATHADHIKPVRRGGAVFNVDNLQSMCWNCHSAKTAREDGGFGNRRKRSGLAFTIEGYPTDPDHPWNAGERK